MGFKEGFQKPTRETEKHKVFWLTLTDYENSMKFWQKNTLEFLGQQIEIPIDNGQKLSLNLTQETPEEKAKIIEIFLKNRQNLASLYYLTCQYAQRNNSLSTIDCLSYAIFIATFAKWMNPQNETTIFTGSAIISDCPNEDKIGTRCDHFWSEINGEIFDSSGDFDRYSYADLKPSMGCSDILSGNFWFQRSIN